MRVLAIDPGYERCGVAVMAKEDKKETVLYSGCIQTTKDLPFHERLSIVANECGRLIGEYSPIALAIEKVYFNANKKTAMAVSEVRGALINTALERRLAVSEYTPSQIKVAVTGYGNADKKQIISMVQKLVKIEKEIQFDDEYDAIAIGITHLAQH